MNEIFGLGLDSHELSAAQVFARTLIMYGATLALVKIGARRLFGRATLFDAIVAIMLGSIMSRGITGSSGLLQTTAAATGLIFIHWLLATTALRFSSVGPIVKGNPVLLIKDGVVQEKEMQEARITMNDLEEALRLQASHEDPSQVKAAYLERNGKISVIPQRTSRDGAVT